MQLAEARLRFRQPSRALFARRIGSAAEEERDVNLTRRLAQLHHSLAEEGPEVGSIYSIAYRLPERLDECVDERVWFDEAGVVGRLAETAVRPQQIDAAAVELSGIVPAQSESWHMKNSQPTS